MVHYFIVVYFRNPKLQGVVWFGLISEIFSYFFAYHDKLVSIVSIFKAGKNFDFQNKISVELKQFLEAEASF